MNDHQGERKLRMGMLGCGSIGSRIASSIHDASHPFAQLAGVYDIDGTKADDLARRTGGPSLLRNNLDDLLSCSDFIVEAVNGRETAGLVRRVLSAGKGIMVMSTGCLLDDSGLFSLARSHGAALLVPSGAIAGIDAFRAAAAAGIDSITLTTYKPLDGLAGAPYLESRRIVLSDIKTETVIFDGDVRSAVAAFPRNINVAATLALAVGSPDKLRVRIITSPAFERNRHEICAEGPFGRITTVTENVPCPDNPRTSYLAVLSGVETLRAFCQSVKIGT